MSEIELKPVQNKEELIERYAKLNNMSVEDAAKEEILQGDSIDEIMKRLNQATLAKINAQQAPLNRAARRARAKKLGKKGQSQVSTITDAATKLNYIDLIQKLRKLNEEKEKENYEDTDEDNRSVQN